MLGLNASASGSAAAYAPWSAKATIVETSATIHPPQTSRAARADARPSGQTSKRNAVAPTNRTMPVKIPNRPMAYSAPTIASPPCWVSRRLARPSTFADAAPLPTVNVNAPRTGWESAEMTRQVTTYEPLSRFGTDALTAEPLPPGCFGDPTSTAVAARVVEADRAERGLDRFAEPEDDGCGDRASCAVALGVLLSSTACADAVPAVIPTSVSATNAAAASRTAGRRVRGRYMLTSAPRSTRVDRPGSSGRVSIQVMRSPTISVTCPVSLNAAV